MNWKIFLTGWISIAFIAFPANLFGCAGGDIDYADYYTSFFNKDASETTGFQPFYYTSLINFYEGAIYGSADSLQSDPVIDEWIGYSGKNIPRKSVADFIYNYPVQHTALLLDYITVKQRAAVPDSLIENKMAGYFYKSRDSSALRYLLFAKETEQFCNATTDYWEPKPATDSTKLNKYITKASAEQAKNKNLFLQNKYAFQCCKLAFYNKRFSDCVNWCNQFFPDANTSALKRMATGYKAGSLFRMGRKPEASYYYSKIFSGSLPDKKKIFLGFLWATDNCNKDLETDYLKWCKSTEEKATMLSMFGLYGTGYRLNTIQKIYELAPASPVLDIVALREVSKLEEQYLTPTLSDKKGGKAYFENFSMVDSASPRNQLVKTIAVFEMIASGKLTANRGLYYAAAAYVAFMNEDYPKARQLIQSAGSISLTKKIADQLQLIKLLTLVNENPVINAAVETNLLPLLQWLEQKAKTELCYKIFYRNLFSELIARKYQQQHEEFKAALAYGAADLHQFGKLNEEDYYSGYNTGLSYVSDEINTDQLLKLYALLTDQHATPFDKFLVTHASFNKDLVTNVLGTSYLRDFNFAKAIEWFKRSGNKESLETETYNSLTEQSAHININPFHDYINDWSRYDKSLPKAFTKLSLARKLQDLEKSIDTAKTSDGKSKIYYLLATAFYNMSYYGNSWMAVASNRTTTDWNTGHYSTNWEREYFGVYKAGAYYHQAYELAGDKEFKAAALFLEAKCRQRQVPLPAWNSDDNHFDYKFRNNELFPKFTKEFADTKFYKYASNHCSYLRDFVKRK